MIILGWVMVQYNVLGFGWICARDTARGQTRPSLWRDLNPWSDQQAAIRYFAGHHLQSDSSMVDDTKYSVLVLSSGALRSGRTASCLGVEQSLDECGSGSGTAIAEVMVRKRGLFRRVPWHRW